MIPFLVAQLNLIQLIQSAYILRPPNPVVAPRFRNLKIWAEKFKCGKN